MIKNLKNSFYLDSALLLIKNYDFKELLNCPYKSILSRYENTSKIS